MVIDVDRDVHYERAQMITLSPNTRYQNQLILNGTLNIAEITCQISNTIGSSQIYPIIGKI